MYNIVICANMVPENYQRRDGQLLIYPAAQFSNLEFPILFKCPELYIISMLRIMNYIILISYVSLSDIPIFPISWQHIKKSFFLFLFIWLIITL